MLEQAFGGRRKYIAQKIRPASPIVKCIGWEAAQNLAKHFGGMQLYIPMTLALMERNRTIVSQRTMGQSAIELAQYYGLVARIIRKICQGCHQSSYKSIGNNEDRTSNYC